MSNRSEQFVVNDRGKRTSVILSIKDYEKLLGDLHDLAIVAERREEIPISFKRLESLLKTDGRI